MKSSLLRRILIMVICLSALTVMLCSCAPSESESAQMAESAEAVKTAIMEKALQCYVIEGSYPESLSYLEQNYGLAVNHEDYLVVYTPFAENMPPDIRVIPRHG